MARAKKEVVLTPEERLQAALVPDWEWPYKLPENWCWTYLGVVSEIVMGQSPAGKSTTNDSSYMPLIGGAADMGELYPQISRFTKTPTKQSQTDDVILSIRATLGRPIFSDGIYCLGRGVVAFRSSIVTKEFLRYFFIDQENYLYQNATGTTFAQVDSKILKSMPFPLPPFHEQRRIVRRVESLFTKLDEAKDKAQKVVDEFKTHKAAILHQAFTGELTAKWREEHGVGMESWEVRTLDSVCSSIFDGDHMPPPKAESGIPFLVISNVNTGHLTFENTRFVPQEYYDNLSDTRKPQLGDVLYTLVGSFGIPVVVNSKRPFCFQRHMALLRPIDVSPQFLWYILQTPEMYDKASSIATGTAQLTVPIKGLRAMTIPRPNIAEQVEIVRILDGFFAREQSAKEAAEAVLDQIDLMKKSILARAFRGELGTNDPNEERAVELLKKVLHTSAEPKSKTKRKFIPPKIEAQIKTDLERKIIMAFIQSDTAIMPIQQLMSVSSRKFDVIETLRNLQERGILLKENDTYRLMG